MTGMKTRLPILLLTAGSLLLAGCGGGDKDEDTAENAPDASSSPASTPEPLDGTFAGTFANVPEPPKDSPEVTGTVEMVVSGSGTKVTIAAEGLDDKAVYVAHVHADACAADDPGGAHFMFDSAGAAKPPNEIHVALKVSGKKGAGEASNPKAVTNAAKSMVIHVKRAAGETKDAEKPPKLACADFVKK